MALAVGFFQFGVISLGIMLLKILVQAHAHVVPEFSTYLDQNALWLYLIPLLWTVAANFVESSGKQGVAYQLMRAVGVMLVIGIAVVFGVATAEIHRL